VGASPASAFGRTFPPMATQRTDKRTPSDLRDASQTLVRDAVALGTLDRDFTRELGAYGRITGP